MQFRIATNYALMIYNYITMATLYRKRQTWYIAYELPRGSDGKRRRRVIACIGMKRCEARQRLIEIERELARGGPTARNISIAEYLFEWLEMCKTGRRLSSTTLWSYNSYIRNHIVPQIGSIDLTALCPLHIERLLAYAAQRNLSAKTQREIYGILRVALNRAVKLRLIPSNPVDAVDPPRITRSSARVVDCSGLQRILREARNTPHWIPIAIAAATGMRRGEICGLRWEDIHFDRAIAVVRRSIVQLPGRQLEIKSTKTGRERIIALPQVLVLELRRHRQQQLQLGQPFIDRGWVCTTETGEIYPPNKLSRAFSRIAARTGINISLHGLRHSQASILLDLGHPLTAISERLGHTSVNTTANIYSHALPHQQTSIAIAINRILCDCR